MLTTSAKGVNQGRANGEGSAMAIAFPSIELLSRQSSYEWGVTYFHPKGLFCPHCVGAKGRAEVQLIMIF